MRKIIMSVLLASVAASPVMALDRTDRQAAREEREQQREERQKARQEQQQQQQQQEQQARERVRERPAMERQRPAVDAQQVEQFRQRRGGDAPVANDQAPMRRPGADRVRPGQQVDRAQDRRDYREELRERRDARNPATAPGVQADRVRQDARGRVDARRQEWDQRRAERIARQQEIRNQRPPVVSPTPRPGTQPPPPPPSSTRPSTYPSYNWSSNHWRNDRRYNWYDHRNRYWWLFQLGWYNDPFGWGYQPYNIGWRMWPSYYSSNYWLDDPWQYRLPYAPAGTRWIRYWDDAILVDLWSGQVVDVIYNFFW